VQAGLFITSQPSIPTRIPSTLSPFDKSRTTLTCLGLSTFSAKDAYACLSSVPFNPAVATRFLQYYNQTLQLQSTVTQLKNPPKGYQQPAVDVQEELATIQKRIDDGFYGNQYTFEADVQLLTFALHDGHVNLKAGVLAAFSFGSPFEIASVSVDGKEPPKIYLTGELLKRFSST